jgi:hypothetical protein
VLHHVCTLGSGLFTGFALRSSGLRCRVLFSIERVKFARASNSDSVRRLGLGGYDEIIIS